jgi:hypothetical protein
MGVSDPREFIAAESRHPPKTQEIVLKTPPTKSFENHHKRDRKTTMRNNAEPSIHTMKGSYKV